MSTEFTLAPALASIVRPGVIWWSGATVVLHEHRLDPLLAEAEAKVRITPPAESVAVRTMYKKVGIDPTGRKFEHYYPPDIRLVADFFSRENFEKATR